MVNKGNHFSKELQYSDLEVSKTNPRFVQMVSDEETAIAQLINLEPDKMLKLTKSIIDKGLLPIVLYCIENGGKYEVLDGNRRLTVIKIIHNPNLIPETSKTKELIELCNKNSNIKLPQTVPCIVFKTWSDDVFDVLSSLHITDESKSDWTPLAQYRMSMRHKGKKYQWMKTLLFYFDDGYVDKITNKKADVFNRMFTAINTCGISILDSGELNIKDAKQRLENFCKIIKANTVNTRTPQEEFKDKVNEIFVNGVQPKLDDFLISIENNQIYQDQKFTSNLLGICIKDKNGKNVKFTNNDLSMKFITPAMQEIDTIDTSKLGEWKLICAYGNTEERFYLNVVERLKSIIKLTAEKATVKLGNSVNLREYISLAKNNYGEEVKDKVKIKAVKGQNLVINNDVLSGDTPEGTYKIQYQLEEYSKVLYLEVSDKDDFAPLFGEVIKTNLIAWKNKTKISFNNTIAALVNEINSIDYNKCPNLIACSCRSIFEIIYDELDAKDIIIINPIDQKNDPNKKLELRVKLKRIIDTLLYNLTEICCKKDSKTFPSWHDEKNFLDRLSNETELKALNAILNSPTHKAGQGTNFIQLEEYIRKDISRLLALVDVLLS